MAYTILNTDGTTLLLLADGQVDKSATSLTLIGKNFAAYGQDLNNNFVKLLANFASSSGNPPRSPLTGQIWYDTTIRRLKVYDNGFKTVSAVNVASSQPTSLQTGDLWFDSTNQQLKLYSSGAVYNVGPSFPSTIGETGLTMPASVITDQDSNSKNVILLKSYGSTVGLVHYDESGNKESFQMDLNDLATYAPNATTSTVVSGVTILGDLNVEGRLSNNYLSLTVDIDVISPVPNNDALKFYTDDLGFTGTAVTYQNPAIEKILDQVFPPNPVSGTSTSTAVNGLLPGTEARVLCRASTLADYPMPVDGKYQVRLFRTVGTSPNASWKAYYYRTDTIVTLVKDFVDVPVNYISTSTN